MTDREATRHGGRGEVVPVEEISADVATVPTDGAESDGTLAWDREP